MPHAHKTCPVLIRHVLLSLGMAYARRTSWLMNHRACLIFMGHVLCSRAMAYARRTSPMFVGHVRCSQNMSHPQCVPRVRAHGMFCQTCQLNNKRHLLLQQMWCIRTTVALGVEAKRCTPRRDSANGELIARRHIAPQR